MFYHFILFCAALCNSTGTARVNISPNLRYTIIINDIIVEKNKEIPEYLFQDMTDTSPEADNNHQYEDMDNSITITIRTKKAVG